KGARLLSYQASEINMSFIAASGLRKGLIGAISLSILLGFSITTFPTAAAATSSASTAAAPLTVALNSFNGGNFSSGIYLTSPGISVKDTPANKAAFHKGAKVRFADGQIRTITVLYPSGGN